MTSTIGTRIREHLEDIRFGAERGLAAAFPHLVRGTFGLIDDPEDRPIWKDRRTLLATGMRIDEDVDPEIHALVERSREALGVTSPVEVYQLPGNDPNGLNAQMRGFREAALLVFMGRFLTMLGPAEQLHVIGHELGHYLAHAIQPSWYPSLSRRPPGTIPDRVKELYRMSRELTADRFGLLTCQDLVPVLRVEMVHTSGLAVNELRWKPGAYLIQSRQLMKELREHKQPIDGTTHPEHNMRAYASWLFSESDLYRDLTGKGPGTRAISDINQELAELLQLESHLSEHAPFRGLSPYAAPPPSEPAQPSPPAASASPPASNQPPADTTPSVVDPLVEAWIERAQKAVEKAHGHIGSMSQKLREAATDPVDVTATLADVSRRTREGLASLAGAARSHTRPAPPPIDEPEVDPLADDERALVARFEELERRFSKR